MCFLWLNDKNDFFFLDTEMQKKQAHTPYLGKVKKKKGLFPSALWHQRFFMVCSLRYGMPHEPPQDLSHQSTMREWACSQAVCHSFILALLGMVIGSQSTSIDGLALDQDDWVARLSMHVYIALCVLVRGSACLPCMHATLSEQQHICVTPSPLSFEFWSLINHCQYCCAPSLASWMQRRTVFLWTSILDFTIKLLSRHSWILFSWKWAFRLTLSIGNVWERTHFVSHS